MPPVVGSVSVHVPAAAATVTVNGVVQKFNDLPAMYRNNIDTQVPLDGRAAGSQPPMSDQDLADLEAFLNTLTDGYQPPQ